MLKTQLLFLSLIITQGLAGDTRSLLLRTITDTKYQCSHPSCPLSMIIFTSTSRQCQIACLNHYQCSLITFNSLNNQCEIFEENSLQYGNYTAQTGAITMVSAVNTQVSTVPAYTITSTVTYSTTTTTTSSTSTSTTTTTKTTTSSTTTTTTSANTCASGSLRWNTTGITVLNTSLSVAASGLFVDISNALYFVDENINQVVWKLISNTINPTVVAGIFGLAGPNSSQLYYPNDVYIDRYGNMYVSDCYNHRIQKYSNESKTGITIAGFTGSAGSAPNQFNTPRYFVFDATDTYMYIADYNCHRIMRHLTNSTTGSNGTIMAGGTGGYNQNTSLNSPWGIHYLPFISNDLFITNYGGHSVIRWTLGASSGVFVAGVPGVAGSNSTLLNSPMGIKVDSYLNLYVVDNGNHRVQMFCANNRTGITIAGNGTAGNSATQLNGPRGIAFDSAMNMYIGDFGNNRVQKFLRL